MTSEPAAPGASSSGKSRSGCLTALYIALGIVFVALIAMVIGGWLFVRSETGQRMIGVAREGIGLMNEAARAPGTDALRAAGCSQAMVMPVDRMAELLQVLRDQGGPVAGELPLEGTMLFCQLAGDGTTPDCAQVARIYGEAVPDGPERFGVVVQASRQSRPVCQGSYGRDGTLLGPLAEP